MDKKGLSEKKLKNLLVIWQKKLKLDDWSIDLRIIEFNRKDYRQSGDIKVYPRKKQALILLTDSPFRDEEKVLVHELVHLLLWDFDRFSEKYIPQDKGRLKGAHKKYMEKLEITVDHITNILFKK